MKKLCLSIGAAGLAMAVYAADNAVFKADLKSLNEQGAPNLWKVNGTGELKVYKDDDIGEALKLTVTKKGNFSIYTPDFPVTAGKAYMVTFKFKSAKFGPGAYNKIDSSAVIRFRNEAGTELAPLNYHSAMSSPSVGQIAFPYGDEKAWTAKSLAFIAPPNAVSAYFTSHAGNDLSDQAMPETCFANFMVRELPSEPAEQKILELKATTFANGDAAKKEATEVSSIKDKKGNLTYGPYSKLPPGIYEVTVSLKIDDNTSDSPVFLISIEDNGSSSANFSLTGKDFAKPNTYQDFSFRVVKVNSAPLNLPTYKAAGVVIGFEKVKVSALKQFKPEELEEFIAPVSN